MRVTNNMMLHNTTSNINGNKYNLNNLNNQMSSQKKISRPSEDPVIAIRALRFRSTLSDINQYYEKNIPDAESWLDVTETALNNIKNIVTDIRSLCVYGSSDQLKTDDRKTILTQLQALREQVYAEGNTDYAGRTIFTGYRTNCNLTFMEAEANTTYEIQQRVSYQDIEEHRYYNGQLQLDTPEAMAGGTTGITNPTEYEYDRIRLAYNGISDLGTLDASGTRTAEITTTAVDANGDPVNITFDGTTNVIYDTEEDWKQAVAAGTAVPADNGAVFIKDTGELVLGKDLSETLKSQKASLEINYKKTGFDKGELRPEYYFNCQDTTDANRTISYEKFDAEGNEIYQDIEYFIAANQTLAVNTNASDVFNANMGRDIDDMINAVQQAIDANEKADKLKEQMQSDKYQGEEAQANLQKWLDAAEKEAAYANDNLQKLYDSYIGKFDDYLSDANLAIATNGSKGERLALTEERVSNQQLTVKTLQSTNEDRELSDIIIDYTAAYTAYQASLQAAGKLYQTTLLNYI